MLWYKYNFLYEKSECEVIIWPQFVCLIMNILENANNVNFTSGLFAMTERRLISPGKFHHNDRVVCPTCRRATDFGNIAFADDRQDVACHSFDKTEASMTVQGSYSTKVNAICNYINEVIIITFDLCQGCKICQVLVGHLWRLAPSA